jgi:hypothetical protein
MHLDIAALVNKYGLVPLLFGIREHIINEVRMLQQRADPSDQPAIYALTIIADEIIAALKIANTHLAEELLARMVKEHLS